MLKKKTLIFIFTIIMVFSIFINTTFAISVPEKDINLKIINLTKGCEVYILLPESLFGYNLEKFISNNRDNPYELEAKEAEILQNYLSNKDYLGYIEYFKELGFKVENNEMELRHYCFCLSAAEVIGNYEYNDTNYIQMKIHLNEDNEFKLILKDYLLNFDVSTIKFMIDEYGTKTYIDMDGRIFKQNPEKPHITECNIDFQFYASEEYDSIEKSINLTYLIIYLILIIIAIIVINKVIKYKKMKKEELEARKFWKKKLTKEEKKAEKIKKKQEKKDAKKAKKKK